VSYNILFTLLSVIQEQKKYYRSEKKRAAQELLSTLKDPSVIIIAEWLKVRGSLKSWTKFWCVLKPGLLLLYKSHKMKVFVFNCFVETLLIVSVLKLRFTTYDT